MFALLLGAGSAGDTQGRGRTEFTLGRPGSNQFAAADPSAVVAAELAFARLARDKGQWTAFRATADKDAIMFVPQAANALTFLKKRADPPKAIAWSPGRIFIACDASYAISTGPWTRPDGSTGTFITLWREQPDRNYKWVLDFGTDKPFGQAAGGKGDDADDIGIEGKIADCPARGGRLGARASEAAGEPGGERVPDFERSKRDGRAKPSKMKLEVERIPDPPPADGDGRSTDGSLRWAWTSGDHGRTLRVTMRYQGEDKTVIDEHVEAGA